MKNSLSEKKQVPWKCFASKTRTEANPASRGPGMIGSCQKNPLGEGTPRAPKGDDGCVCYSERVQGSELRTLTWV